MPKFKKLSLMSYRAQAALMTGLMFSPLAAFAGSTDPSDQIVAQVEQSQTGSVKIAIAVTVLVFAIAAAKWYRRAK